jgi:hypothetical protein
MSNIASIDYIMQPNPETFDGNEYMSETVQKCSQDISVLIDKIFVPRKPYRGFVRCKQLLLSDFLIGLSNIYIYIFHFSRIFSRNMFSPLCGAARYCHPPGAV